MHRRVLEAIKGMYIGDERPTVALAVGGQQPWTAANDDSVKEPPQTWPDPADRELANWSSSSSKKFMAAEIVIGTVDQVLLGGLPVKHAHLRLAALSRHLLVVDELHSYDRYMTEVLRRVLDLHTGAGGIALFMSATLSDAARTRYAATAARSPREQTYSHIEARELAYPSLAVCGADEADWRFTQLESGSEPKVVRWSATGVTEALGMAVSAASEGARVLVLRNTVRAARETIRWLHDNGHNSLLWRPKDGSDLTPAYHSRYTLPDRLALDKAAGARFGKDAAAVTGGVILVSTQVAEQSLDVDFDLLISDLCPVDVLLQRIGRLHRHSVRNEHRPTGSRQAQAWVIAPEGGFAPFLKRKGMDLGWGEDRPYPNYADGELTLRLIRGLEWQEIVIPRDNRALIEAVYHGDPRKDLECDAEWDAYLIQAEGRESGRAWQGRTTALNFAHTYPDCAGQFTDAAEKHVYTRLGDQSVRIELNGDVRCWYSSPEQPVRHIDLPLWALAGIEVAGISEEPLPVNSGEHGTWFQLGARVFTYTQAGWEWEDA
jgi:CRISPR-associated endonuclease/helicase Cas3